MTQRREAPTWLTTRAAAACSDLTEYTIRKKCRTGEIRAYQLTPNGRYRITRDDLDAFLRGEHLPPPGPPSRAKQPA